MQFQKTFWILVLTGFLTGWGSIRAETLKQMTAEALRKNPDLRTFERTVAAARGGVRTARMLQNPELTVAPGFRRNEDSGKSSDLFHAEFALSQLLKFPGKRALEIAIAQSRVELAEIALEGFRFQLATRVRRAAYDQLAAEKIGQTRRDQVESAKTFVELARKRVESGYASDFELLKGQVELIAASKELHQTETQIAAARISLNRLMGRPAASPVKIDHDLAAVDRGGLSKNFLALALARNPAIRIQIRQAKVAGLNLRSTRLERRPDLTIGPAVEYLDNEQTYGLSASLALPLWDRKQGAIETATAEQTKALAELEKTRSEIEAEITKALANLTAANRQLALYSPGFLDQLKQLMAQAEEGYAHNTTTLAIYLDAKRTYFDTLADYYESLFKVAESRADLESAAGVALDSNR